MDDLQPVPALPEAVFADIQAVLLKTRILVSGTNVPNE